MKGYGLLFLALLVLPKLVFSQAQRDSTFSILINSGISFTHANDPHINRWLAKYGYPAEPRVPSSLNFEIAAIPQSSRLMYSLRVSRISSGKNLSSFNILGGLYRVLIKNRDFLVMAGLGAGYHKDIITLNGGLPPEYRLLANQYNKELSLRRNGLFLEPAIRAFWYPMSFHRLQLGLFAGLGFDMDFNSRWRLGYYDNTHGRYHHFSKINKPSDQKRVSEYGLAYNAGLSLHLHLQ